MQNCRRNTRLNLMPFKQQKLLSLTLVSICLNGVLPPVCAAEVTSAFPATTTESTAGLAEPAAQGSPVIDRKNALAGRELLAALRRGGYVLYMRHAATGTVTEKCDTSNLSTAGVAQATHVGGALRRLAIPIEAVWSSRYCRARDTARLLNVGEVRVTDDLNLISARQVDEFVAARYRQLARVPRIGTNVILVSHVFTVGPKARWISPEIAETIVYRPDGIGGATPVARIGVDAWVELSERAHDGH